MTDNTFDNKGGGDQNVAQGDGAIGKQVNNYYGISEERADELKDQLSITDLTLRNFFKILEENQVPRDDLDSKLRDIAAQYKELLARLATVQSEDPEVRRLKDEARQAIEAGKYAEAEDLLNRAEARDVQAIEELEQAARQRRISAAATNVDQAKLQELQWHYEKAAAYWQKAAALLPEEEKKDKAYYLNEAGYDLYRIAEYTKALPLYEQSLALYQEIGDRAGEDCTLNNLATLAYAKGDYAAALTYLEQSLDIFRETGGKAEEGTLLNNISQIYDARGEYDTALKYLEQSLVISKEIGDRAGEAVTSWNIGMIYKDQGDLSKAEQYMARTVEIDEAIGHPDLESDRKELAELRAKLRGR
ncbi:MAG: tetratricopeptide repeat protein [Candidatus Electrothrix scaldis]|nr:MAG: tetratricopeptide repeat protein [Candidatus Electrothrix sp. GW3-3]